MNKKIILAIFIFFGFINITNATIYNDPQFHLIENNVDSEVTNSDFYILPDDENAIEFCKGLNQELKYYSTGTTINEKKAYFDNSDNKWKDTSSDYEDYISQINCQNILDKTFTIHKVEDNPRKVLNGESLFDIGTGLFKENFGTYDWLDSEEFGTNHNGLISGQILTASGEIETVTLDISGISENPQLIQLMILLYDIRLILVIFLGFWLFFKFYDYLTKIFYFLRR